ncbi:MAG: hypothetical protein K9M49_00480 [Candidatus Marinimicrobia bacterium]|nr:hypothetical protein [Candidatus Neomarinimicrobiota bacterium]MCF7903603.1 hypothetical protein [Candidatus Neomarinimicrobiota bacterium]
MMKFSPGLFVSVITLVASMAWGQDDIEKYLLTDSLQIEALLDVASGQDHDDQEVAAQAFTQFGLAGRQFSGLSALNTVLEAKGYGAISQVSPGWLFGTRIDVGDHVTLGFNYQGNYFLTGFSEGTSESARYTYFTFLVNGGYRTQFAGMQIVPGLGMGISQSMLTLKPNGTEEISWTELHANNDLISTIGQLDFAVSLGLSVGKYITSNKGKERLLNVSVGMIFHPFSFNSPGVVGGEFNTVQVAGMPDMHSSGFNISLTWGLSPKSD